MKICVSSKYASVTSNILWTSASFGNQYLVPLPVDAAKYSSAHSSRLFVLMILLARIKGNALYVDALCEVDAAFAAASASSLPAIPTWALTQTNLTSKRTSSIDFRHSFTNWFVLEGKESALSPKRLSEKIVASVLRCLTHHSGASLRASSSAWKHSGFNLNFLDVVLPSCFAMKAAPTPASDLLPSVKMLVGDDSASAST